MQGKLRVTDVIGEDEIQKWHCDTPIIISAGTGVGKSYFVKNTLYEFARLGQKKILMLIHRRLCVEQFQMEIESDHKDDVIDIMTYQKLEKIEMYEAKINLEKYAYIVCDEFHYFISDAGFNNVTDISFKKILEVEGAIKVFMSATGEDVESYMKHLTGIKPQVYTVPHDWSFIKTLFFYHNDESLPEFAQGIIERGKKGIFFIQQAKKAYKLYEEFKENAIFNCSSHNQKYYKHVDTGKINHMLKVQKFDENILITTSCMDAGVNIIDPEVLYIFVDIKDVGSLIQCIGRKRIQSADDTFDLYIKVINNQQLGGLETFAKKELEMAEFLKKHSTQELISKYPRQLDMSKIIYDDKCVDYQDNQLCTKKVNDLMYHKKQLSIDEMQTMKSLGKFGYCYYMAKKLGKGHDYEVIRANYGLEHYLSTRVGFIMYQTKDRNELIKMMDVRRDGHLRRSRDILNAALKEEGLPYRIEEFTTSKTVDGKKKNFKAAWRIVKHDWSIK